MFMNNELRQLRDNGVRQPRDNGYFKHMLTPKHAHPWDDQSPDVFETATNLIMHELGKCMHVSIEHELQYILHHL